MNSPTRYHPPAAVLASDLDGTLIPLVDNTQNRQDLEVLTQGLARSASTIVFVTGRHFASVMQAMANFKLPEPDWLICDVGTSIYQRSHDTHFELVEDYSNHLQQTIRGYPLDRLKQQLQSIDGLRLQEAEKQGPFKLSFYAASDQLEALLPQLEQKVVRTAAPYSLIHSVDPFTGDGLVDFLPQGVSKAYALQWWTQHADLEPAGVVFAGDSGNDLAALTAGYRAILVGNAEPQLVESVRQAHRDAGWSDRLYLAEGTATSGVLQGCRHYGLISDDRMPG